MGSRSDVSGIKAIKKRILFMVSLISKLRLSKRTSTSLQIRLNNTTLSGKPWTRRTWRISSFSFQIRLSSWEICSQRQVSLQFHHLVGCYCPKSWKLSAAKWPNCERSNAPIFRICVLFAILILLRLFECNFIFGAEANTFSPGWSPSCNRNKISARLAGLKFQPGLKFAM